MGSSQPGEIRTQVKGGGKLEERVDGPPSGNCKPEPGIATLPGNDSVTAEREKLTLCWRYWPGASTGRSVVMRAKMPSASRTETERVIIQISPPPASK